MVLLVIKVEIIKYLMFGLFALTFIIIPPTRAGDYPPELSGKLELGDRVQLEEDSMELTDEVFDCDYYQRCWLKYKQQLERYDYYYLKLQYYQKEYQKEIRYNNNSIDLWGNYTYCLNEKLRNGWLFNLRRKDYYFNEDGDYLQLRIKYQLDFAFDERNDYTFYLQREWQKYNTASSRDNLYDRVSLTWEHQLRDNLQLDTRLELNRELSLDAARKSKNGRKLSLGFDWELDG